jgi:hypothetical protein
MAPQVPPPVLFLVINRPMVEQAKKAGISSRQFRRLLAKPWSEWRVKYAVKWCSSVGMDFWDLKFTPQMVAAVNWASGSEITVNALKMMHHAQNGRYPSRSEMASLRIFLATPCGDPG